MFSGEPSLYKNQSRGTKAAAVWGRKRKIAVYQEEDVCRRVREARNKKAKLEVIQDLAQEFDCSTHTVKVVLRRHDVGGWKKGLKNQSYFSEKTKLEIVALFKGGGHTVAQLGRKFGCGTTLIYKILNAHDVFRKDDTRKRQPNAQYTTNIDYPLAPGVNLNPQYKGVD